MAGFLSFLVILAVNTFWGGFVAATLWGWFMVPLGVMAISFWHAVGLAALLNVYLGSRGLPNGENKDVLDVFIEGLVIAALFPLIMLVIGYIAKSFI